MRIFIEPLEPLHFRTGRPFDAGEIGYAETLFPPTPETLQGAIRAMLAGYQDEAKTLAQIFSEDKTVKLIGDRESYGRFRITGVALGRRIPSMSDGKKDKVERLFPAPAHLQQTKKEQEQRQLVVFKPQLVHAWESDLGSSQFYLLPNSSADDKLESPGWLTERGLQKILSGDNLLDKNDIVAEGAIYKREPRMGIGMNNATKTTREGLLYQMQMIRMEKDYGFVVDFKLTSLPDSSAETGMVSDEEMKSQLHLPDQGQGMMTIGGERRAALFSIIPDDQDLLPQRTKGNLLYLATPAAFDTGWQPQTWASPLAMPITAAITRYQSIGGWRLNPDDSGGTGKVMRRCVPAGSTYFFDREVSINQPFTDYGKEIGFGIAYIGEWK